LCRASPSFRPADPADARSVVALGRRSGSAAPGRGGAAELAHRGTQPAEGPGCLGGGPSGAAPPRAERTTGRIAEPPVLRRPEADGGAPGRPARQEAARGPLRCDHGVRQAVQPPGRPRVSLLPATSAGAPEVTRVRVAQHRAPGGSRFSADPRRAAGEELRQKTRRPAQAGSSASASAATSRGVAAGALSGSSKNRSTSSIRVVSR